MMDVKCNLTLAICMYNAERYVEETLESVIAQTMQNFYLLIVNDCSSDKSIEVVEQFFVKHPRQYELITLDENGGIANARNFALNHTNTEFLLFIDADDLLDPTLVEKEFLTISSDKDLIGVSCWSQFINEKGEKVHGGTFLGEQDKALFINKASEKKLIFLPIHTMFSTNYAKKSGGFCISGFPEGKPRMQDYCEELDLWTRMSDFYKEGKALIVIPQVLYYYRKSDGLSSNHFNMIIKMRYTKTNLLRRRNGERELSFIDFYNGLSKNELNEYKRDAKAADNLRNGVFYLKRKNILKAIWLILKSVWYKPSYIFEKLKYNSGIKR